MLQFSVMRMTVLLNPRMARHGIQRILHLQCLLNTLLKNGVAHDVESMLTNFDFIADPTAIDNSSNDGKLYVYGTTEAFSYQNGKMVANKYANHSITILSTSDMVNWTDEGFLDTQNLTNEPSDSDNKVGTKFTSGNTWAPSGLKIDGDGEWPG